MPPKNHSLLAFRLRILAAVGLGTVLTHLPSSRANAETTSSTGSDDTGSTGGSSTSGDGTSSSSGSSSSSSSTGSSSGNAETGGSTGDMSNDDFDDCSGCYGRPYIIDHHARVAPFDSTQPWAEPSRPSEADLSPAQRQALAAFWLDAARAEHSSIAGFLRFGLELMALGAPESLLARAQKASVDEREHARACFEMAAAYGVVTGPGAIDLGAAAPLAQSLEAFAEATVREGCVGETVAAWLARTLAEQAQDPAAHDVLTKIADEEAEHAELAWAALRWAIDAGGERVRRAAARAFAEARLTAPAAPTPAVPSHGLLEQQASEAAMRAAMAQIIEPCAAELLAA